MLWCMGCGQHASTTNDSSKVLGPASPYEDNTRLSATSRVSSSVTKPHSSSSRPRPTQARNRPVSVHHSAPSARLPHTGRLAKLQAERAALEAALRDLCAEESTIHDQQPSPDAFVFANELSPSKSPLLQDTISDEDALFADDESLPDVSLARNKFIDVEAIASEDEDENGSNGYDGQDMDQYDDGFVVSDDHIDVDSNEPKDTAVADGEATITLSDDGDERASSPDDVVILDEQSERAQSPCSPPLAESNAPSPDAVFLDDGPAYPGTAEHLRIQAESRQSSTHILDDDINYALLPASRDCNTRFGMLYSNS
ncbi:hypothetical protein CYLTODRAFT_460591 [Cylindrobasidium torrendii FP15055 ss-10]|uniref:Uncharacterized protein n=1 Tax=Cylindrobasidium torrendii FP15055 ss-10 TaxID=1314674 RepID=A0A0D7AS33_9AGAR|nr:hypothetical protein CYLTODRAFT_460591 [Cylindrobasidium torrendii FP15055 ss-10]